MSPGLKPWVDRYDSMSLRERLLVMSAGFGLIALLWDALLMSPMDRQRKAMGQQMTLLREDVARLNVTVEEIATASSEDPSYALREEAVRLRAEIAGLEDQLEGLTSGLIAPTEMTNVLEALLKRRAGVSLVSLRTLDAVPLLADAPALTDEEEARRKEQPRIYKHGVEMVLQGSYLETLAFLESVEKLKWRFFWERIDYRVEAHPTARIRLVLRTLGVREGWIGV